MSPKTRVGYDYAHAFVDDHSRLGDVELLPDERAVTVTGFLDRALAFFASHGIQPRRLTTDIALIYVNSRSLRELLTAPRRPQSRARPDGSWHRKASSHAGSRLRTGVHGRASQSGAGLEAQRLAIAAECARRGWQLVTVAEDAGFSAKDLKRFGIQEALRVLEEGDAKALVAAKLDRLSRSMIDFTALMATAQRQGWALVALDCAVDTTTPAGEAMANVLATFAQFERRLISQRTREALAVKRSQGVRLGRPVTLPASVARRIRREREKGTTLAEIADRLNREGVATAQGGAAWYPATVRSVLQRIERG